MCVLVNVCVHTCRSNIDSLDNLLLYLQSNKNQNIEKRITYYNYDIEEQRDRHRKLGTTTKTLDDDMFSSFRLYFSLSLSTPLPHPLQPSIIIHQWVSRFRLQVCNATQRTLFLISLKIVNCDVIVSGTGNVTEHCRVIKFDCVCMCVCLQFTRSSYSCPSKKFKSEQDRFFLAIFGLILVRIISQFS